MSASGWYIFSFDGSAFQLMNPFVQTAFSTKATLGPYAIGAPGTLATGASIAHGFSTIPKFVAYWLCVANSGGYGPKIVVGQTRVPLDCIVTSLKDNSGNLTYTPAATVMVDNTNVNIYWTYDTTVVAGGASDTILKTNAGGSLVGGAYPIFVVGGVDNRADWQLVVELWA
jgi:hypothetical protein